MFIIPVCGVGLIAVPLFLYIIAGAFWEVFGASIMNMFFTVGVIIAIIVGIWFMRVLYRVFSSFLQDRNKEFYSESTVKSYRYFVE